MLTSDDFKTDEPNVQGILKWRAKIRNRTFSPGRNRQCQFLNHLLSLKLIVTPFSMTRRIRPQENIIYRGMDSGVQYSESCQERTPILQGIYCRYGNPMIT